MAVGFKQEACKWLVSNSEYRALQEIAYINVEGATLQSVYGQMLVCVLAVVLQHHSSWPSLLEGRGLFAAALADAAVSALPLSLALSTPSWVAVHLPVMAAACCALALLRMEHSPWVFLRQRLQAPLGAFSHIDTEGHRLRFVAEYRAVVLAATCVAILAVDFPSLYSRSHAKTEEYGVSLMDLGTGCITFSSAICSKQTQRQSSLGERPNAVFRRLLKIWPVLAIGFVRLALLRGIDYHVPTSEYGVHWNFFFTIAVIAVVTTALDLGPKISGLLGGMMLMLYELFLSAFGGAEYILSAPRETLFSANREGILSCFGFLSLHYVSVTIGSFLRSRERSAPQLAIALLGFAFFMSLLVTVLGAGGLQVSRRMCNLPYVALILSVNCFVLGLLAAFDLICSRPRPSLPLFYKGAQDSMLTGFLLANLLTGLVNLSLQPLFVPPWGACLIMSTYSWAWSSAMALLASKPVAGKTM